jgi:hypothetical protein
LLLHFVRLVNLPVTQRIRSHFGPHQLTAEEARAFFEAAVQDQLGVKAEDFLKRCEDFRDRERAED